ncbi:MAG TPA: 16S rRNA (guanine(966)-N(2))-methyltransferase RsmD [Candidatus Polarisedimenticolia bacterium]|nr:16S rRNA (guanine(966)-N(2))-methyltransferase RsmD [Candidatus Polarisedimenticolia bacterium]
MAGLRILGGADRGRRLQGESVAGVRPTPARVREALFDILGARVPGAAFLDLYAGTGAVGLEALSRGAARSVFVERGRAVSRALAANVGLVARPGSAEILQEEAGSALRRLTGRGDRFQVVFLDPPWDEGPGEDDLLMAAALLAPAGILVHEHRSGRNVSFPDEARLRPGRSYRYGDASLSLFHRDPGAGAG